MKKFLLISMLIFAANSFAAEVTSVCKPTTNVNKTKTVKKVNPIKKSKTISLKNEARKRQYEKIVYRDNKIYEIYGEPLMATAIVFGDEQIKNLVLSDPTGWKATINENQVYIKPEEIVSRSTMFVTTTKRTYYFNLYSEGNGTYNPVIQFIYPEEQQAMLRNYELMKAEEERNTISFSAMNIEDLNMNYRWNKRYSWSPTQIMDDGQKTWIFLSVKDKDIPTLYIKKDKEMELPLSFRIRETADGQKILEIDKTFKEAVLALHKKTITIKNKSRNY